MNCYIFSMLFYVSPTILLVVIAESFSRGKNPLGTTVNDPFKACLIISEVQFLFLGSAFHQLFWYQLGVIQTYLGAVMFL